MKKILETTEANEIAYKFLDLMLEGSPDHEQGLNLAKGNISSDTIDWIAGDDRSDENQTLAKQILKIRDYIRETGATLDPEQIGAMTYELTADNWTYPRKYIEGVTYKLNALRHIGDPSIIESISHLSPAYISALNKVFGEDLCLGSLDRFNSLVENLTLDQLMAFEKRDHDLRLLMATGLIISLKGLKPFLIRKLLPGRHDNGIHELNAEQIASFKNMDIDGLERLEREFKVSDNYVDFYVHLIIDGKLTAEEAVLSFNRLVKISDEAEREDFMKELRSQF